MKKILSIFLLVNIMLMVSNASAAENCIDIINKFNNSKTVDDTLRNQVAECYISCEKSPNFPNIRQMCGIEDCKYEAAEKGVPSLWCCKMSEYWGSKVGVIKNPLQSLVPVCKSNNVTAQTNFADCTKSFRGSGNFSDKCCAKLDDIKKFDPELGGQAEQFCSQKNAAKACKAQYANNRVYSAACCAYSNVNGGKFSDTKFFKEDSNFAGLLDAGVSMCSNRSLSKDKDYAACMSNFYATKSLSKSCCVAYYNGVLIPDGKKMKLDTLNRYCYPEDYR